MATLAKRPWRNDPGETILRMNSDQYIQLNGLVNFETTGHQARRDARWTCSIVYPKRVTILKLLRLITSSMVCEIAVSDGQALTNEILKCWESWRNCHEYCEELCEDLLINNYCENDPRPADYPIREDHDMEVNSFHCTVMQSINEMNVIFPTSESIGPSRRSQAIMVQTWRTNQTAQETTIN